MQHRTRVRTVMNMRRLTAIASGTALVIAGTLITTPAQANATNRVSVTLIGGYAPKAAIGARLPVLYVYGERSYRPGAVIAVYPGPAVEPVEQITYARAVVDRAALSLFNTLVTPAGGWGEPPVADVPATRIDVTVKGRTRTVSIPALGLEGAGSVTNTAGPGVTAAQRSARQRVLNALNAFDALSGPSTMYRPSRYEIWPSRITTTDPALSGGLDELSSVIEWSKAPAVRDGGCAIVTSIPRGANQASWYRNPAAGVWFTAQFRPVLPGEQACRRSR